MSTTSHYFVLSFPSFSLCSMIRSESFTPLVLPYAMLAPTCFNGLAISCDLTKNRMLIYWAYHILFLFHGIQRKRKLKGKQPRVPAVKQILLLFLTLGILQASTLASKYLSSSPSLERLISNLLFSLM